MLARRNTHFVPLQQRLEAAGLSEKVSKRLCLTTFGAVWKDNPTLAPVGKDLSQWAELVTLGTHGATSWNRTVRAWETTIGYLDLYGLTLADVPHTPALNALVALFARFPDSATSTRPLGWMYAGALSGRYRASSSLSARRDVDAVHCALNTEEALAELIRTADFREAHHVTADQLLDKQGKDALRSLAWATTYARSARDWITGRPLTRADQLHVHHIFPKQLSRQGLIAGEIDCIANTAYLNASTNESLGDQAPEHALVRTDLIHAALTEQWIWRDADLRKVERFPDAMTYRATRMAVDFNGWVEELLSNTGRPDSADNDRDHRDQVAALLANPLVMRGKRPPAGSPRWAPGTVLALGSNGRVRVRVGPDGELVLAPGSMIFTKAKDSLPKIVGETVEQLRAGGHLGPIQGDKAELLRPVSAPPLRFQ